LGGAEYALHNFGPDGIDDSLVNCFEFASMLRDVDDIDSRVNEVTASLRPFKPERRVAYAVPRQRLLDEITRLATGTFGSVELYDGIIYDNGKLFWNIRASSNEYSLTLNINGERAADVEKADHELQGIILSVDKSVRFGGGNA